MENSEYQHRASPLPVLQFGHGGDAVENVIPLPTAVPRKSLQFGHGGDAVENCGVAQKFAKVTAASIRPRR